MDKYEQEEVMTKVEPDQIEEPQQTATEAERRGYERRSDRTRIANRQFRDYELYIIVEQEELMLATVDKNPAEDKEDEKVLAVVANYMCYSLLPQLGLCGFY
jgi:hypothetical protein